MCAALICEGTDVDLPCHEPAGCIQSPKRSRKCPSVTNQSAAAAWVPMTQDPQLGSSLASAPPAGITVSQPPMSAGSQQAQPPAAEVIQGMLAESPVLTEAELAIHEALREMQSNPELKRVAGKARHAAARPPAARFRR